MSGPRRLGEGAGRPLARAAPPQRRLLRASAPTRRLGAYCVLRVADPDGPSPVPGQFTMLAAAERWGRGRTSAPNVPRAFSGWRACATARPTTCSRTVGPGTRRLRELAPGEGVCSPGAASAAAWLARARPARAAWSAAALASRRCDPSGRARRGATRIGAMGCGEAMSRAQAPGALSACSWAFTTRPAAEGAALLRQRASSRAMTARRATPAASPTYSPRRWSREPRPSSTRAAGAMLEAVRALCEQRGVPSAAWRSRPAWRAVSAPASDASCRAAAATTCAYASTGHPRRCRALDRRGRRTRGHRRERGASAACRSRTRSSTARALSTAIAANRAFGERDLRRALSRSRPTSQRRSRSTPRRGNPPPRLWEAAPWD